eukprot:EG_transcript_3654
MALGAQLAGPRYYGDPSAATALRGRRPRVPRKLPAACLLTFCIVAVLLAVSPVEKAGPTALQSIPKAVARHPMWTHPVVASATAALALGVGGPALADVPPGLMYDGSVVDMAEPQAVTTTISQSTTGGLSGLSLAAPPLVGFTPPTGRSWSYSDFLKAVKARQVEQVTITQEANSLELITRSGQKAEVRYPSTADLGDLLVNNGVDVFVKLPADKGDGWGSSVLSALVTVFFVIPVCIFICSSALATVLSSAFDQFLRSKQSGVEELSETLSSLRATTRSKELKSLFAEITTTGITFADVAGADGAKLELQEVVDFLKNPAKYTRLGARLPKGALLVGPPGTGKTLLAKAVAGEAGVPFFLASASEFIELYVGVGSARVRQLFKKAKAKAPCIIFIDELDAVGRARGAGYGGGNDEREQTVNQLLTEMDGFETNAGVVVLAATNRNDVLDKALLRPGRFDRQITVDYPDLEGRVSILKVHAKGKPIAASVDLAEIARRTPGFSGADLANLLNEAAIAAARRRSTEGIVTTDIVRALEGLIVGPEKAGTVINAEKRKLIAYHEAGHALVGSLIPGYDTVTKISIVPRGGAGGITYFTPQEERLQSGLYSRRYLEDQMAVLLGGRVAEEVVFGEKGTTIGAQQDFEQVTSTARRMVTQLGFCDEIGQVALAQDSGPTFLGQQAGHTSFMSQETAAIVDEEVKRLVQRAYRRAKDLLLKNEGCLHTVAEGLLQAEVMDGAALRDIIARAGAAPYTAEDAPHIALPYQSA